MQKDKYTLVDVIIGRFFIILTVFVISLILVDYVSTFFLSSRSKIETRFPLGNIRKPYPFIMFKGADNGSEINKNGYRGDPADLNKSEDEFRIFIVGGSTVFEGDPTIIDILHKKLLSDGFDNTKVYNYGVISSNSGMDLARIIYEIADYKPDLIIMYNCGNDILHPYSYDPRPGNPFNFIVYENNPILDSDISEFKHFAISLYGSNLARYFFPQFFLNEFVNLEKTRISVKYGTLQWKNEIADIYLRNILKASLFSKAIGSEFIAYFQPVLYNKKVKTEKELKYVIPTEEAHVTELQKIILEKADRLIDQNIFRDIRNVYENNEEDIFNDVIHTNSHAKEIIASLIKDDILNLQIIKTASIKKNKGNSYVKSCF